MKLCDRCDRIVTQDTACSFADCPHKDMTAAASAAAPAKPIENIVAAANAPAPQSAAPLDEIRCAACSTYNIRSAKYCAGCGSNLAAQAVVVEPEPPVEESIAAPVAEPTQQWSDTPQGPSMRNIGFGLAALMIIGLLAYLAFGKGDGAQNTTTAATAETTEAVPAEPLGQERSMWVVADANIRNRATAQGSELKGKIPRGTQINGVMQMGEDGKSQWFRLTGDRGFVGAVNLSQSEPPKLAKPLGDQSWYAPDAVAVLALPDGNSPKIATLKLGQNVKLAGITDNGFAEVKMGRGGVGYIAPDGYDFSVSTPVLATGNSGENGEFFNALGQDSSKGPFVFTAIAADQDIRITLWPTQFSSNMATAEYRNTGSGNRCSAFLSLIGRDEKGRFRFSQVQTGQGNPCRALTDVIMSPANGYVNAWWQNGDQAFMSAKLRM